MARPKQFDDEQLLDSLRETYLELGPGASTQELAQAAGVSEGTLFKRFGTKRKIFMAAMRLPLLEDQVWYVQMLDRAGKGSFEAHLRDLARGGLEFASQVMPRMQMIIANGKLAHADVVCLVRDEPEDEPPPFLLLARFAKLFEIEMDLGRIRRADPVALASLFVGALFHDLHLRMQYPNDAREGSIAFGVRIVRTIVDLTALTPGAHTETLSNASVSGETKPTVDSEVTKSRKPRRTMR
jgi:AcrR family transcriptional regulator